MNDGPSVEKQARARDDVLAVSEVYRFPLRSRLRPFRPRRPRLYVLNWQRREVLKRMKIPPPYFDPDEYRFLDRCYHYGGARGIAANERFVFVALQNAVLVYERGLDRLVRRIEHPLFNGIHEVAWHRDRLFVTCAVTDSLIAVDETGAERQRFCLGARPFLLEAFRLEPRNLDNRLDYRLMHRAQRLFHVNSVQVRNGSVFVLLNRQGAFVRLYPREEIIIHDPGLKESHNAQFSDDGEHILINDSGHYALNVYSADGVLRRRIDLRRFPIPVDFSRFKTFDRGRHPVRSGWLRGLAFSAVHSHVVYLGLSPTLVIAVDYVAGTFRGVFRFRRDFHISVHGLCNLSRVPCEVQS
jgi:hypothetical protein